MNATSIEVPKFHPDQVVRFMGGQGLVRSYKFEFGNWTYLVEMAMGLEPDFGRVGPETMVLLDEADLCAA
jgi:hypothetical protein